MRTSRTFLLAVVFLLMLNVTAAYAAGTPDLEMPERYDLAQKSDAVAGEGTVLADPEEKPPQENTQMWSVGAMGVNASDLRLVGSYLVNDATWINDTRWYMDMYYATADDRLGAGVSVEYVPLRIPLLDRVGVGAHVTDGQKMKADFYIMKTITSF